MSAAPTNSAAGAGAAAAGLPQPLANRDGMNWTENMIVLSNDTPAVEYCVSRRGAALSGLLKGLLDETNPGDQTALPVPEVNGATLKYVVQYVEYHKDAPAEAIPKPLLDKTIREVTSQWDQNFLFGDLVRGGDEKQHDILMDVIMAANFLDIKPLLELTCAMLGSMIKNKNRAQLCDLFGIPDDFTPEEEERVRRENNWNEEPAEAAAAQAAAAAAAAYNSAVAAAAGDAAAGGGAAAAAAGKK